MLTDVSCESVAYIQYDSEVIFMKNNDKKDSVEENELGLHREFHDLEGTVCSSWDCTGLIPTPPQSEAEEESYEELYPFLPDSFS